MNNFSFFIFNYSFVICRELKEEKPILEKRESF